jgi:hypothetical protein
MMGQRKEAKKPVRFSGERSTRTKVYVYYIYMTCIVTGGKEELGISIMNDLLPRLLDILGGKKSY